MKLETCLYDLHMGQDGFPQLFDLRSILWTYIEIAWVQESLVSISECSAMFVLTCLAISRHATRDRAVDCTIQCHRQATGTSVVSVVTSEPRLTDSAASPVWSSIRYLSASVAIDAVTLFNSCNAPDKGEICSVLTAMISARPSACGNRCDAGRDVNDYQRAREWSQTGENRLLNPDIQQIVVATISVRK